MSVQQSLNATFMRGGTSKAVVFHAADLPADRADQDAIFLAIMGSPDPNGRQLDGMGGGVSSLSKVCVVGPPSRPDADVDYTFAQVSVGSASVDYGANCGNMSSAIGPFAVDEGLVTADGDAATVRIHNTNTGKIIVSTFALEDGTAAVDGDFAIDGVAGTAARIRLDFLDPGGARTGSLLPTGNPVDVLSMPGLGDIEVSMVDAANPCVFVDAASIGATGTELPDELESQPRILDALEAIRRHASVAMGIAPDLDAAAAFAGIPKVAMVTAPIAARTLSGVMTQPDDADIIVRMISMERPHRAVPVTGGLCLAVACRIEGSIPARLATIRGDDVRIGHPSGGLTVDADVIESATGVEVVSATLFRTARRLFQGQVLYRAPVLVPA